MCGRTRTRAPRRRIARTMFDLEPEVDDRRSADRRRSGDSDVGDRRRRDLADEVLVLPARHAPGAATAASRSVSPGAGRRSRAGSRWRAGDGRERGCRRRRSPGSSASRSSAASWRASSRTAAVALATTSARSHGRIDWSSSIEPPVVADERIGHDHDLPRVRGVGADLLVAGLAGVDDQVAAGRDRRTERDPGKTDPSSSASNAGPRSPILGSTTALDRGVGGTGRAITWLRIQRTHRPRGLGGQTRAQTSMPPSPASRDRYASLTGPAMKGRRQGSIPGGRRAAATPPESKRPSGRDRKGVRPKGSDWVRA